MSADSKDAKLISFRDVLKKELGEIESSRGDRRARSEGPSAEGDTFEKAHSMKLLGLALSGGGIRSATFNLGILQALAELKLLHMFDYLSTVSGGGYIGSWLASWISREGSVKAAEEMLHCRTETGSQHEEYRPVMFIRRYSNYLTPRIGAFSPDTWALISTFMRNIALNALLYFPLFLAVLLLPVLLTGVFKYAMSRWEIPPMVFLGMATVLLGLSGFLVGRNLSYNVLADATNPWYTTHGSVLLFAVLPSALSAILGSFTLWFHSSYYKPRWLLYAVSVALVYLVCWAGGMWRTANGKKCLGKQVAVQTQTSTSPSVGMGVKISSTVFSGALWIIMLAIVFKLLSYFDPKDISNVWYVMTLGMPLMILLYMSVVTLQIGILGRDFPDERREWWSRFGGWLFIFMFVWVGFFGIVLIGPPTLIWVKQLGISVIGTGWIASTVGGLLAGKSSLTGKEGANRWLEIGAKAAPYVFVAGLLFICSLCLSLICIGLSHQLPDFWSIIWTYNGSFKGLLDTTTYFITVVDRGVFAKVFIACIALHLILSRRIDINQFSMHLLYRNRLIRCYLGASNKARNQQPFTGFDPNDDVVLSSLQSSQSYDGPYPIVNTTLNLTGGRELAWQERRAASFIFTPMYSGYELARAKKECRDGKTFYSNIVQSCYCPTGEYSNGEGVKLGEAMAISGAAASPNMGYHTSKPLAFLMTIFNIRLGWWYANPALPGLWRKAGTPWGLKYLLAELFGLTTSESKYVYLSDGGHFENLGIYELVRRRCAVIVACDASCDPKSTFEDLGNAIRKIRVDLGIRIEIVTSHLRKDSSSKMHCSVGTIYYEEVDGGENGTLIYIKPVLCGDEPVDVFNYWKAHKTFPHQTTADQWFNESQLEAYRMLGYHSLKKAFPDSWKGKRIEDFIEQVSAYVETGKHAGKQPEASGKKCG